MLLVYTSKLRLLFQILKSESYSLTETGEGNFDERREMDCSSWGRNNVIITQHREKGEIIEYEGGHKNIIEWWSQNKKPSLKFALFQTWRRLSSI